MTTRSKKRNADNVSATSDVEVKEDIESKSEMKRATMAATKANDGVARAPKRKKSSTKDKSTKTDKMAQKLTATTFPFVDLTFIDELNAKHKAVCLSMFLYDVCDICGVGNESAHCGHGDIKERTCCCQGELWKDASNITTYCRTGIKLDLYKLL
jgi:hypothetical protein